MIWRKYIIISFTIIFLATILGNTQKEQVFQYKAEVFLVELQVTVVDKEGKFVEDLKPGDFTILDKGKEQKISHFDYVVHNKQNIDLISRGTPANRRHFFLLFDLTFANPRGLINAREAAFTFIEKQILPTDLVAVGTFSAYQGLKSLVNFTNDKRQLLEVINSLGLKKATHLISDPNGYNFENLIETLEAESDSGGSAGGGRIDRAEINSYFVEIFTSMKKIDAKTYKMYVSNFVGDLMNLGVALNAMKGKKYIVYFSEGFHGKVLTGTSLQEKGRDTEAFLQGQYQNIDSDERYGDSAIRQNMEKALKQFVSSDCVIQTIDIGGLRAEKAAGRFDEQQTGHTTLHLMADETGGKLYSNINDLNQALDDILQSSSRYYVIGYYPKDVGKKGKFRDIKVKVNRPGIKLVTRKGYYEDKPYKKYTKLEKKIRLAEYIIKDVIENDIQFDVSALVFPGKKQLTRVPIFLQFPGKQFLIDKKRKKRRLEMYGYLIDEGGYFKDFYFADITIDVNKSRDKLESHGIKYFDMLLASPGKHKVKIVVQDHETGEVGTRICYITVPDYQSKKLTMTGPIFFEDEMLWLLGRGYNPDKPEGKKVGLPVNYPFTLGKREFIPAVIPKLKVGQPAQFCLKVYNLMLHPEAKVPQTKMNFEIVDSEGKSHTVKKISLANRPTKGEHDCFELMFKFVLDENPPGRYQFKITIADTLAKQQVQSTSPIILEL